MNVPMSGWVPVWAPGSIAAAVAFRLVVSGALTQDLNPVGVTAASAFDIQIGAEPDLVSDAIAGPYLGRTPRRWRTGSGFSRPGQTWCWPSITPPGWADGQAENRASFDGR